MNIFVVSEYYAPDNFRINDITEELVKAGHHVRVLTGLPDYTTSRIPKAYRWFRRRHETINGVEVIRVPTIARRSGLLFRVLNYGSFVVSSYLYAAFCRKKDIDVIFVYQTSPVFQAYPAVKLKKRTGKKLFLYCCDLWPESLKAWNVGEGSKVFQIVHKISNKLYGSCDKIAVTSDPFIDYVEDVNGVSRERITYLPQHAEDLYKDICGRYEENDCIDFLFAGNIGAVQNVDCIIRALSFVKTDKSYHVHIVGDGSSLEECKRLADQLGVHDHITFHGRFPLAEMERFYRMADCFLLTLRGGDFIGLTLPAKSQGYLSAGKPILGAIDGAAADMIKEADCGECVKAGDAEALGQKMTEMIENFDAYREKGLNGRRFYEQNYTKEKFLEAFLNLINKD